VVYLDASSDLKIENISSMEPEYRPDSMNATARLGGGSGLWGGKVTLPSVSNWFFHRDTAAPGWLEFGKFCEMSPSGESIFDDSVFGKRGNRSIWRPALEEIRIPNFSTDTHVHLKNKMKLNFAVGDFASKSLRVASSLKIRPGHKSYAITYADDSGELVNFAAGNLFLASGALGNAILLSRITGQTEFPLGNHAAGIVGIISFPQRLFLARFGSLVPWGIFSSWSKLIQGAHNHSFRLSPIATLAAQVRTMVKNIVSGKFLQAAEVIVNIFSTYIFQMPKTASLFAMLDTGLHAELRLKGYSNETQKAESMSVSVIDREYLVSAKQDFSKLTREIEGLGCARIESLAWPTFVDTHHYFGTCPMSESSEKYLTVDSGFQVKNWPGLFALGSSAFPQGSHGHPTLLAAKTAEFVVQRLFP
jgi:hypothetical protein